MPRETIHTNGWNVQVGWDREGSVQVGVSKPDAKPGDPEGSMWATLNRWQINDLIRLLRKARDGAFGRDE